MIKHFRMDKPLTIICALLTVICACLYVFLGCVHLLSISTLLAIAAVVAYRTMFAIVKRGQPVDLSRLVDVVTNLKTLLQRRNDQNEGSRSGHESYGGVSTGYDSSDPVMSELNLYMKHIMDDFIVSWYTNVSSNEQFLLDIQFALEDLSLALVSRVKKLDAKLLLKKGLHIYHQYFLNFIQQYDPGTTGTTHFALESSVTEMQHLYNVVNVLLEVLLPSDVLSSNLGRKLLVDLLTGKVLGPIVNLFADPSWLNQNILALIANPEQKTFGVSVQAAPVEIVETRNPCEAECMEDGIQEGDDEAAPGNIAQTRSASDLMAAGSDEIDVPAEGCSDGIWQRMAGELPAAFRCEREQEVSDLVQEASVTLDLKKKPVRIPLSGSIERLSDIFSGSISFDSISSNIAQYFKSASEEDKPPLTVRSSSDEDGSVGECVPFPNSSQRTNSDEEPQQLPSPEFHVKSVLERLFHMTTGPVLSEHAFSINNKLMEKHIKDDGRLPSLSVSESVESTESCGSEDFELKGCHLKTSFESADNFKLCKDDIQTTSTPDMSHYQTVELPTYSTTFENLNILGTEIIEDANSGSYVVYCIQYDVSFQNNSPTKTEDSDNNSESLDTEPVVQTCFVRRRFREFIALQTRLENDPQLRHAMKGIKGPNKWTVLPFSKLDKEAITERRQVLENYLQSLLAKEDIARCIHLKEFLAYGNDPSIAYVRKAVDGGLPVPRIDKFLMKTMTGVFDKLKTALPSLPHDLSPIEPFNNKTSDRLLGFLNLTPGIPDEIPLRITFDFVTEKDPCVDGLLSQFLGTYGGNFDAVDTAYDAADIDAWQHDPWASPSDSQKEAADISTAISKPMDLSNQQSTSNCADDEIPLASAILNLALATIQKDDTKLNKEPFVSVIKLFFGQLLERWMCMLVDSYTTDKMITKYLKAIRESVWPNGVFGLRSTTLLSDADRSRIYGSTLQALKDSFPGLIVIMLGKAQYESSVKLIFDSFQNPKMLRHFVYHLLDLIVDALLMRNRSQSIIERLSLL